MKYILVILLLLFGMLFYLNQYNHEGFENRTVKPNESLFEDDIFYQYDSDTDKPTGYDKCITECNGVCVDYGLTGSAWCYPYIDDEE